jgi:predicted RNase H-like HicB family nuclease
MPSFPGAYSQGRTKQQAYRNLLCAMRELIETYEILSRRRAHVIIRDAAK